MRLCSCRSKFVHDYEKLTRLLLLQTLVRNKWQDFAVTSSECFVLTARLLNTTARFPTRPRRISSSALTQLPDTEVTLTSGSPSLPLRSCVRSCRLPLSCRQGCPAPSAVPAFRHLSIKTVGRSSMKLGLSVCFFEFSGVKKLSDNIFFLHVCTVVEEFDTRAKK